MEVLSTDGPIFSDRLMPGEKIAWAGRPATGIVFTGRDAILIPFSIVWLSFAVFWESGASTVNNGKSAPHFFILWGAMFVCIGLYLTIGRFIFDSILRRSTHYAVTDQRILILRTGILSTFKTVALNVLPEANLKERSDGSGTIIFGQSASLNQRGFSSWSPSLDPTPQFIAIQDACRVFDLVQRLKLAAK